MEDFFPVIILIIGIAGSLLSSSKAAKAKKEAEEKRQAAVAARIEAAQKKKAAASRPVTIQPSMSFADIPGQVIAPTVHPHIKPDCNTHDVPGSLGVTSMEGKDPCHEDELTLERTFAEPAPAEGGLTFNWTGSNMVHAVVMQEVLTRPCQRRAR